MQSSGMESKRYYSGTATESLPGRFDLTAESVTGETPPRGPGARKCGPVLPLPELLLPPRACRQDARGGPGSVHPHRR